MQRKYIKDKNRLVTKRTEIIPLKPLIPLSFAKKNPSTDLTSNNFQIRGNNIQYRGVLTIIFIIRLWTFLFSKNGLAQTVLPSDM
jgi:hypothetical protein